MQIKWYHIAPALLLSAIVSTPVRCEEIDSAEKEITVPSRNDRDRNRESARGHESDNPDGDGSSSGMVTVEESDDGDVLALAEAMSRARLLEKEAAVQMEPTPAYTKALANYLLVMEGAPDQATQAEAWFGAGRCALKLGQIWRAFLYLEKSFPTRFDAREVRARLGYEIKIAEALRKLEEADVPGSETGGTAEGKKLLTGWQAASRVFAAIVYNDPHAPRAAECLLAAADCYARAKDLERAEQSYRNLMRHFGETKEAVHARAGLAWVLTRQAEEHATPQDLRFEVEQLLLECKDMAVVDATLEARIARVRGEQDQSKAEDLLRKARFHLKRNMRGDRNASVFLLKDLIAKYPESAAALEAAGMLSELGESE